MSVYKMSNAQTVKFVQLYRDAQCLWDVNSEQYKDRDARDKALAEISVQMGIKGFGPREVAQKAKNIRSSYYQELKKIAATRKSGAGEVYRPRTPWFEIIDTFLKKMPRTHFAASLMERNGGVKQETIEIYDDYSSDYAEQTEKNIDAPQNLESQHVHKKPKFTILTAPPYSSGETSAPLKVFMPLRAPDALGGAADTPPQDKTTARGETEFDVWAKSIAMQLNNMELSQALRLQLKLQSLLIEERIMYECRQ